jgi:CRP-like cAMP-binding protein
MFAAIINRRRKRKRFCVQPFYVSLNHLTQLSLLQGRTARTQRSTIADLDPEDCAMLLQHTMVRNAILSSLPPEDLASLRPHFQFAKFTEGAHLQEQKRRIEQIGFVETGVVSLRRTSQDDIVELALVGSHGIVGATRLLGSDESSHQCIAVTGGSMLSISASALLSVMEQRQPIKEHLYHHVQMLLVQCSQVVLCGLYHGLTQRLAGWLCHASNAMNGAEIPVTHDYLSTMLGLRRASVTEALNHLEQDGLILKIRGAVRVRDRLALKLRACDCYSTIESSRLSIPPIRSDMQVS